MWTAIGIALFVVGLLLSIAWHEAGHLWTAKLFGVRVTQYMVGFGPTLFSRTRRGTEYGIKAVPLGGFIRMVGMVPPETASATGTSGSARAFRQLIDRSRQADRDQVCAADEGRQFYRLHPAKRIIVMIAGPLHNLLIAVVLLVIIVTVIGTPMRAPVVDQVSPCLAQSATTSGSCVPGDAPTPAALAGLQPGDRITAISGHPITDWEQAVGLIQASAGTTVSLTYRRADRLTTVQIPIVLNDIAVTGPDGQPAGTERTGFLGVVPAIEYRTEPPVAAFTVIGDFIGKALTTVVALPGRVLPLWDAVFGGGRREPGSPVGIVGASRIGGEIFSLDIGEKGRLLLFLQLLAGFNMSLFLLNMLPVLPLDGGHILGAGIEWVRRGWARIRGRALPGPFDAARLMPLAYVVVLLFLGLSALTFLADIVNPVSLR